MVRPPVSSSLAVAITGLAGPSAITPDIARVMRIYPYPVTGNITVARGSRETD